MKDYVCIYGYNSIKNYKDAVGFSPLSCCLNNCDRGLFDVDWENINKKCSSRRVLKVGEKEEKA